MQLEYTAVSRPVQPDFLIGPFVQLCERGSSGSVWVHRDFIYRCALCGRTVVFLRPIDGAPVYLCDVTEDPPVRGFPDFPKSWHADLRRPWHVCEEDWP